MSRNRRRAVLAAAGTATAGLALAAWLLPAGSGAVPSAPAPVSHIDTATRACLLTSTDTDTAGTWEAMRQLADASAEHLTWRACGAPRVAPSAKKGARSRQTISMPGR
ncbi:hypothetical protein [Streptomyces hyaluromycini]|uniref:hypothetical protein n=1 Tax=Streptomyces hyaluromycini TaxID=1377993 RepID=UPI0011AEC195|nr:hypothetical protein [Streptomyces hyaluromycini]